VIRRFVLSFLPVLLLPLLSGAPLAVARAGDDEPSPGPSKAVPHEIQKKATPQKAPQDNVARVMRLGLRRALELGMTGNLTLQEGAYATPLAQQARIAAAASFDTLLTASFNVAHDESPVTNTFLGQGVTTDDSLLAQAGVTRLLTSGGTISLLYRADRLSTNNPFATVNPAYTSTLTAEIRQPLLRGAGDTALADIRRAQNGVVGARATYEGQVEAVLLQVAEAYWELVFADANLAAQGKSLEVARELLADATSRLHAEVGTPLDVAEARAGVERRRSEVLDAENLRETLEDRLLALIVPFGPSVRAAIHLEPTDRAGVGAEALPHRSDEARYVDLALKGRQELRASRADIAVRGIDVLVAKDAIRPQLDLVGRAAGDGLASGLGGSLEDIVTGRANSAAIGLEFSLFIGRRAARAEWLSAAWRRRQALLRYRELQNGVVVQVRGALRDLETARAQLAAGRAEVAAAQEGLSGERLKLGQGKSTPFRVLQKEDDLTAARTREARAAADVSIASARLLRAVGSLASSMDVSTRRWPTCPDCR